jgi:hypothetical protein
MKIPIQLSHYDVQYVLEKSGDTRKLEDLDSDELNQALYSIGFNITGLIVDECLHRPIFSPNNEPWYGKRYLANERQDKEWLRSGKASLENTINSNPDTDHRRDLIVMSTQSNNTLEIIEHMEHKD